MPKIEANGIQIYYELHGPEDADPLVPVEGGIDTADSIPGAELMIIEGMGHSLPAEVALRIIEAIVRHTV